VTSRVIFTQTTGANRGTAAATDAGNCTTDYPA
jgi:hypothetical protein